MHDGRPVGVMQISVGMRCWMCVVFVYMRIEVVYLCSCCCFRVVLATDLLLHRNHPQLLLCYFLLLVLCILQRVLGNRRPIGLVPRRVIYPFP